MRISETGLRVDFPLVHPLSQQLCLIQQARNENRSGVNVCVKSGVQPSQLQTEPSSCRALGRAPCAAPPLRAALGWLCLTLPTSSACHKPSMVPLGSGSSGQACGLSHPAMLPSGQGPWLQLCPLSLPSTTGGSGSQQGCFGQ